MAMATSARKSLTKAMGEDPHIRAFTSNLNSNLELLKNATIQMIIGKLLWRGTNE
jgi:hypothetical protein